MDGDAFLYVKADEVCLCSTGLRDGGIQYFLREIFKKAKLRKDAPHFELIKAANLNKIAFIKKHGIKEVELKATLYQASADYAKRKTQPFSILGAVAKQFRAVIGKDNDVTNDALKAILTIRVDHRIRKSMALGEKRVEHIATELINNQEGTDDFVIVTKDEQRISPNEIFMRSTVHIDKVGKSVDRDKAWKELKSFYKRLESSGALEE